MKRAAIVLALLACGMLAGVWFVSTNAAPPVVDAAPMPAEEAARSMIVPEGFRVALFAAEPVVQQPIGFCLDDRGRLWVAEAYNYPQHGERPGDRIVILEDVDGDGRHDKRTVFFEGLNYVTGVEVGFGGAWVVSPPSLFFIPDADGDDRPDRPPVKLLDGFGTHANSHNLANALAWGPDGWLYGTHGRTNWSLIGKPGATDAERVRFDGGVYRYHPTRHVWEPFADGTTNPWGIDWDDWGQAFVCNCVDPHLFHVIQGAHYEPWRGRESSRHAYERIATIADHRHFIGQGSVADGLGTPEEDLAGGGHAHCGTMIYLGDSWPAQYRNTVFMHNLHGKRINNDILKRSGSGYTASHGRDFLRAGDPWFMGVTLKQGPDGAVYSSDWSDTGECHSTVNTQRGTGRIYKIQYGDRKADRVDLAKRTSGELAELQTHANEWFVRHARRLLHERAAAGEDLHAVAQRLRSKLTGELPADRKLRVLWALHAIGQADEASLLEWTHDKSEHVRAWSVRLLTDGASTSPAARTRFVAMAAEDTSPLVVLHLACALQRIALADRWPLAEALAARGEFASDQNVPLLIWYGVEPLIADDMPRFANLATKAKTPLLRRHGARRIASSPQYRRSGVALLSDALVGATREKRRDLLAGILAGLEGTRSFDAPASWPDAWENLRDTNDRVTLSLANRLALVFDDVKARTELLVVAKNQSADAETRCDAIEALVGKRVEGFDQTLVVLLADPKVRGQALRGLAVYANEDSARAILERYTELDDEARRDALQTLASRTSWARQLLTAIEAGRVPKTDVTAYTARQMLSLKDKALAADVERVWGPSRETPAERKRLIARYKARLSPEVLRAADRVAGKGVFAKHCGTCHKLFGEGKSIGPELTGAQRTNLDYLLLNLVDPSAAISNDYRMHTVATNDGRVVTGLIAAESEAALTIQTANERIVISKDEIEDRQASNVSMMPEGLLTRLADDETRDLFAYLMGEP